jgi:formiminotetrahydrofolate cyclodeaminase
MHDRSTPIAEFLSATAAKQPTPGGGSVAALAGALAAAIGEMVVAYSVGKKDLAAHHPQLVSISAALAGRRGSLLALMVDDQNAYAALTTARKLSADDSDRAGKIRAAVQDCIDCPATIGMRALQVLTDCDHLVPLVNRYLLSDLAVSAELAMATVRSAGYNVRANLPSIESENQRAGLRELIDGMQKSAVVLIQKIIPAIWARVDAT